MTTENTLITTKKVEAFLIDDDEIHALGLKRMLKKTPENINLTVFGNGETALQFFKENTDAEKLPDIIFLDIDMPVIDGWDFLDEFEKIQSSLPKIIDIYMVSSSINTFDKVRAQSQRLVKDYISKPITINHFYTIFKPTTN